MSEGFGYGGKEPVPASQRALELADAILALIEADNELAAMRSSAPSYTGQWSVEDYYAEEQERYYRAAEKLESILSHKPQGETE